MTLPANGPFPDRIMALFNDLFNDRIIKISILVCVCHF